MPPPQGPKKVMNPHDKKLRQLIWDCWTRIIDDADCSNDLSGLNSTAALPTLNLICDATGVKGNNRVAFCRRWIGQGDVSMALCYAHRGASNALLGNDAAAEADFRKALALEPALTAAFEGLHKLVRLKEYEPVPEPEPEPEPDYLADA